MFTIFVIRGKETLTWNDIMFGELDGTIKAAIRMDPDKIVVVPKKEKQDVRIWNEA